MKNYIQAVLLVQVVTWFLIVFQVPVATQIIGFIYLTFLPGYIILKALRIDNGTIETALLSVGLSLSFLMLVGLAMCAIFPIFGIVAPLSVFPLTAVISGITLLILLVTCRGDIIQSDTSTKFSRLDFRWIPLMVFPALGIVGVVYGNILVLLVMILAIAVVYALGFSTRVVPQKYYLFIILAISLALIFHTSFISNYIMGDDLPWEAYVFRQTLMKGLWVSPGVGVDTTMARFESVLSITILPTVYSLLLDATIETVLKIVVPLILAFVPLVLYKTYEVQSNKTVAFLSILFFMSGTAFFGLESLALARQAIAEFLFVLSIFLLVEKKIPDQPKRILILMLGAGLIVSHYALAYIYIFLIILVYVLSRRWRFGDVLNASMVLLLFAMTFAWYVYVSDAPLLKVADDIARIRNNFLTDIYKPEARGQQVTTLVSAPPTIVSVVHRFVFLSQNFFILVGIALLMFRRGKTGFDAKYRIMSIVAMLIVVANLVIPNVAGTLNLSRFYSTTMIFLAPFFVIGGMALFDSLGKAVSHLATVSRKISQQKRFVSPKNLSIMLVSIVLVASFLFSTGFIEHVTGVYPESWALDKDQKRTSNDPYIRIAYYEEIATEQDVVGVGWLSKHVSKNGTVFCSDVPGVWYSYGLLPIDELRPLETYTGKGNGTYAYLNAMNTIDGQVYSYLSGFFNTTELTPSLDSSNLIYSNGVSESFSGTG